MPASLERTRNELPPPLEPVERPVMVATTKWALQGGTWAGRFWQPSGQTKMSAPRPQARRPENRAAGHDMQAGGSLFSRYQGAGFRLGRARSVARVAIDKGWRLFCRLGSGERHHLAVIGRERASRIGVASIAGDGHGLAAASAPVDLAERARAARLLHPFRSAEGVEGIGIEPDVEQLPVLHIVEAEMFDGLGGVAREDLAGRCDVHEALAPTAHAGLRALGVVIRHHHVDGEHAFEALTLALDELDRLNGLLIGRDQRGAVEVSPAVILDMRDFEPLGAELERKLDVAGHVVNVLPVDRRVDG